MLDKLIGNLATAAFWGALAYAGFVWVLKVDDLVGVFASIVAVVIVVIFQWTAKPKAVKAKPAAEKPKSEEPKAEKPAAG